MLFAKEDDNAVPMTVYFGLIMASSLFLNALSLYITHKKKQRPNTALSDRIKSLIFSVNILLTFTSVPFNFVKELHLDKALLPVSGGKLLLVIMYRVSVFLHYFYLDLFCLATIDRYISICTNWSEAQKKTLLRVFYLVAIPKSASTAILGYFACERERERLLAEGAVEPRACPNKYFATYLVVLLMACGAVCMILYALIIRHVYIKNRVVMFSRSRKAKRRSRRRASLLRKSSNCCCGFRFNYTIDKKLDNSSSGNSATTPAAAIATTGVPMISHTSSSFNAKVTVDDSITAAHSSLAYPDPSVATQYEQDKHENDAFSTINNADKSKKRKGANGRCWWCCCRCLLRESTNKMATCCLKLFDGGSDGSKRELVSLIEFNFSMNSICADNIANSNKKSIRLSRKSSENHIKKAQRHWTIAKLFLVIMASYFACFLPWHLVDTRKIANNRFLYYSFLWELFASPSINLVYILFIIAPNNSNNSKISN